MIKSSKKLEIEVRNAGRVPGSFETHQTYTWVDPTGRTVSPPPEVDHQGRYDPTGIKKSGLMLLKDGDERKVILIIQSNLPPGGIERKVILLGKFNLPPGGSERKVILISQSILQPGGSERKVILIN